MHTFDNLVYDPIHDAIVVTALPEHNRPAKKQAPDATVHPTWLYDLKLQQWRLFDHQGRKPPKMFAAASAYDSDRDTIVGYTSGAFGN